ncbi:sulfatase family protein [Arenibacter aquaticus]|nr:arylsulfatase [Arenibacter aquaticus]
MMLPYFQRRLLLQCWRKDGHYHSMGKTFPFRCLLMVLGLLLLSCGQDKNTKQAHPNIVLILADDLGYGDLGIYNPNSLIPTPNLDKLAMGGIRLTDAYCPVSVCSPSRFALMTGTYPFRSRKKSGVMSNYEPSLIEPDQLTLMQMLEKKGYTTAGYGKWHLGASFPTMDGKKPVGYGKFKADNNGANIDLSRPVSGGPVDHGFEHWLGFSCASECWVLEGNKIMGILEHDYYNVDAAQNKEHLKLFPREQYLSFITDRSTQFLTDHVDKDKDNPFFLYYAPYVPHIPLAVSDNFIGSTDAGLYGDYVHELDFYIGKLLKTLDSLQLSDNTLVLFASDNGSTFTATSRETDFSKVSNNLKEMEVKVADQQVHNPNGKLRGTKQTVWEGGVRTPFIARWPGNIPANTISKELFALNDIMATLAAVLDFDLKENEGIDSYNLLPVLKGDDEVAIRTSVVVQSGRGDKGLRMGKWKYIEPNGANMGKGELYNLENDLSEAHNLIDSLPRRAHELSGALAAIVQGNSSK